jgi:hypothetical protein
MLSFTQILEVAALSAVAIVLLIVIYFLASFILAHIAWVMAIAVLAGAAGLYAVLRTAH